MKTAFCIGYCEDNDMIDGLIRELKSMKGGDGFYYCLGPNTQENRSASCEAMKAYMEERERNNSKQPTLLPTEVN